MPNNSETSVERREQQIYEQSQQNSQQSQQPGAFRIYLSNMDSSRVEETKDDIAESPYPEVRVVAELVQDREQDFSSPSLEREIKADAIVVPTVNMGCGIVVSKPGLHAFGIGLTTLFIVCTAIAIIVLSFTLHPTDPRQKSISNLIYTLSAESDFSDPYSPQSQSKEWILGEDNKHLDPIQDQLLLKQRYALSTVLYGLGNSSNITMYHLGSAPECQWNSQGIQCNDDQWITGLNFCKSKC